MTLRWTILVLMLLVLVSGAAGDEPTTAESEFGAMFPDIQTRGGASTVVKWLGVVTVLSLAPAILVMVTSFTRIVVVLGLLRQALATPQLPPNQILFGLGLLMTLVVMGPVYKDIHRDAITPYFDGNIDQISALRIGETRIRKFLIRQVEAGNNSNDVYAFLPDNLGQRADLTWSDVPTISLIPTFAISELKIAFLIGFRIFLPFLIIDMLVASVLVSMGMLMLPPVLISLPFKLLLFVLADGWTLVVGTLMGSFG